MRICLYTGSALPKLGGQEAVVDALARHLQRLGHEPTVLAPRPRLPLWPRDGKLPYPVVRHPRFFSTGPWLVDAYALFLNRLHAKRSFDVIHCHDVYPTGWIASSHRKRNGVPVVITSHGGDVRPGNRLLAKPGVARRMAIALRRADALVTIGKFTTDGFLAAGATPDNIHLIPNGVDAEPLRTSVPRPDGLDPAVGPGRYLLFIGRFSHRKGVDTLLKALSLLPPAGGVELVIAGSGDLRAAIEQDVRERQLADRVRLVGRVSGAEKSYLLQNAMAVVMPSRGWEAFPLVVLEAYAAGRPVVASDVPGLEDLVSDATGVLVPAESPVDWAAAMQRVRGDDAWRERAGTAARAAAAGYEWDAIARQHVELYERLRRAAPDVRPGIR
jgi:phosphatidylinositol alpha-mannosyltransferase